MFNEEEKKLESWKENITQHNVSNEQLDAIINAGFNKAKQQSQKKKQPYFKRSLWTVLVVAVVMITLITSIRVSPTFANTVASIPGMDKIVALIQDNEGLKSAINNEHYVEIAESGESSGATITLDGTIADEMNMVLFYTIDFKQNHRSDVFERVYFKYANGEEVEWGSISIDYEDDFSTRMKSTNLLEVSWKVPLKHEDLVAEFHMRGGNGEVEIIEIPFTLQTDEVKSEKFVLHEEIVIEGQSITIENITISPVRTAIQMKIAPINTMEIFGFEDLRIVDEKGKTWSAIENGVTASGNPNQPNDITYYLQSNYFEEPKELYVAFNKVMALDKEEAFVVIDTEKKEILQQPKDGRFKKITIENEKISTGMDWVSIEFEGMKGYYHSPFNQYIDVDGKQFDIMAGSTTDNETPQTKYGFELQGAYKNPIKLPLTAYPSYIEGDVQIRIK